jgi:hypothetical protein
MVCSIVGYGARVYTDEYVAYSPLKERGFEHQSVYAILAGSMPGMKYMSTTASVEQTSSSSGYSSSWV